MAGFLKKIFSFGKKEVVETPGLRTDGDELKPIDWAALRDLTRDDEAAKAAELEVAEQARKAADEARRGAAEQAARIAAEQAARIAAEQAAKELEAKAAEEAASKARAEQEAKALAEEAARIAAERQAAEERAAAVREAEEAARQAAEQAADAAQAEQREKAAQEALVKARAERIAEEAAQRLAIELAEKAREEEAQAARLAAERKAAFEAAAEAARQAADKAALDAEHRRTEADAAEDATGRAMELEPRFPEPPEADIPVDLPAEPDLPVEVPPEPLTLETPDHSPPSPVTPDETPEPQIPAEVPEPPKPAPPKPTTPAAPPRPVYNMGLRTGGDELLAPSWMNQPAVQPKPAPPPPPPAPEPSDPGNKVTVSKTVEQKIAPTAPLPEQKLPWFQRLRQGLLKSSRELSNNIAGVFTKRKLDEDTLQDLEDVLLRADLGLEIAMRVTDTLAANRYGKEISDFEVRAVMGAEIEKVLVPVAQPLELDLSHKPHVILVVGVNGTGKTTTIGKLAAKLQDGGLSVMLAAGDTFRAAAIEQLKIWGERTNSPVISSKLGADAAGLAYDAFEQAKAAGSDVLIIDTAGRLQNKTELMAELEKIVRVLGKLDPDAPHTVLQTIDATTGQNALNQVEIFRNVAGVNGLVLTKLDGTARGGILVAIAAKHKLPVYFIGVGEQVDDLEPFVAGDFAKAIAGVG